jgi:LEA14-like dessication related protein
MKKNKLLFALIVLILGTGCAIKKLKTLSTCNFKMDKIASLTVAGVKINTEGKTTISLVDLFKISNSLSQRKLPLYLNADLVAENPNKTEALMSKFDWKITLKGEEVLNGSKETSTKIPANSSATIPFETTVDVFDFVSKYSMEELKTMFTNAFDENGNPKELKLYIKPYLSIGKRGIPYPGYIEMTKYFKNQ